MQLRKIAIEADLMTVCEALFGPTEDWQWNLANNTAYYSGFHIAAWENGKLIGYADCETDCSLLQRWSSRAGVASAMERPARLPGRAACCRSNSTC